MFQELVIKKLSWSKMGYEYYKKREVSSEWIWANNLIWTFKIQNGPNLQELMISGTFLFPAKITWAVQTKMFPSLHKLKRCCLSNYMLIIIALSGGNYDWKLLLFQHSWTLIRTYGRWSLLQTTPSCSHHFKTWIWKWSEWNSSPFSSVCINNSQSRAFFAHILTELYLRTIFLVHFGLWPWSGWKRWCASGRGAVNLQIDLISFWPLLGSFCFTHTFCIIDNKSSALPIKTGRRKA